VASRYCCGCRRQQIEQLGFGWFGSVVPGVNLLKKIIGKCYMYWDPSKVLYKEQFCQGN